MEFLLTFIEGFASFISPCVLPLLPLYISYFAGAESKKHKAIINSIAFVIGFSIIFVCLATIANILGSKIIAITRIIKIFFGIMVIILGISYIGLFNLKIFEKFPKIKANVENLNFIKSLFFGMCFSISMTPCVGTFLTSALLLIASKESLLKGIALIMFYCLGLGIPFIISSILIDRLKNVFSFIKKHFNVIKIISGLILILMGIYIIFF